MREGIELRRIYVAGITLPRTVILPVVVFLLVIGLGVVPAQAGLAVQDGAKITSPTGATSPVITVTGADIPAGGRIIIDNSYDILDLVISSGTFSGANLIVTSDSAAATWSGTVLNQSGIVQNITLTSAGGNTTAGEHITVTLTGAGGNPWLSDTESLYGDLLMPLSVIRTDTGEQATLNFTIDILPPATGSLAIINGTKITSPTGATSASIFVTGSAIPQDGTITIDVPALDAYVASGTFSDANVIVTSGSAAALWTHAVAGTTLTLTSTRNATVAGEEINLTLTGGGGNPWIPNTHGEQTVPLAVGRGGGGGATLSFVIETAPPPALTVSANFSAAPTSDIPPLQVIFTDTSRGNPAAWTWDFGDGSNSTAQNPIHTYTTPGTYTVSLTASNAYGPDRLTRQDYIHVLNGAVTTADTAISGLTVANCAGPQTVTVDTSVIPSSLSPDGLALEIQPPSDRGLKNITIYSQRGFTRQGSLVSGTPVRVHIESAAIAPPGGFSAGTGANASFAWSADLPSYPCSAVLTTKIWEGVIPAYDNKFRRIADGNGAGVAGTAYTATITRTRFPSGLPAQIHMSVNSSWNRGLVGGPGQVFIWRIADDGKSGQILPTGLARTSPADHLDYYEAVSPAGLSTFGLSSLTGNNNPFQIITFVIAEVVNPSGGGGGSGGGSGAAVTVTAKPEDQKAAPPDPGKTARIYANAQGVVTQALSLRSTDGLATVNVSAGTLATGGGGSPLSSITIRAVLPGDLPAPLPGGQYTYTGRAYDLQPDGAAFSPAIGIGFSAPPTQFGQRLVAKMYDNATRSWADLPSDLDPRTGILTVRTAGFCCIALFAESPPVTTAPAHEPTIIVASKSSVSTDVEMYTWIVSVLLNNPLVIVIMAAVVVLAAYFGWWRRRL